MADQPRLTPQTIRVLDALLAGPNSSGADVGRATGLPSGSLYPILLRLERAGWLASEWEAGDPALLGRPRRRLYVVTTSGARQCASAARQLAPALHRLASA